MCARDGIRIYGLSAGFGQSRSLTTGDIFRFVGFQVQPPYLPLVNDHCGLRPPRGFSLPKLGFESCAELLKFGSIFGLPSSCVMI